MGKYSYLNLEQKMIRIRKKIPLLLKKRYSEEVGYDFVKIDDIYNLLTPALNKYGVDFEIVRESCIQKDADGNPVFLAEVNGGWKYEADLEVCWVNADRPSERKEAVVHLIGTHETPEKAKGTAWTYSLKYYLLNRFCIKQGEFEDPDMVNNKPPKDNERENCPVGKNQNTGSGSGRGAHVNQTAEGENTEKTPVQNGNAESKAGNPEPGNAGQGNRTDAGEARKTEKKEVSSGSQVERYSGDFGKMAGTENMWEPANTEAGKNVNKENLITGMSGENAPKENLAAAMSGKNGAKDENPFDGFTHASDEDFVPFDSEDEGEEFVQNLRHDIEDTKTGNEMGIEKAYETKCDFGIFKGKPLREVMGTAKGRGVIEWIAQRYTGNNRELQEAAKCVYESWMAEGKAA